MTFFIYTNRSGPLFIEILKLDEIFETQIKALDFLIYTNNEYRNNSLATHLLNINSDNIVFSSDNLEDCKEYIKIKEEEQKYNL